MGILTNLTQLHYNNLRSSGIKTETMELAKVRSVPQEEFRKLSPLLSNAESGLEFPYLNVPGFSRYKIFPPPDEGMRYYQSGSPNHLYILPPVQAVLSDPTVLLEFFEGEKKTLLAIQNQKMAIGIGGVWNWVIKDTCIGIVDFDSIAWPDRPVEICFDSDIWVRPDLLQAVYAFARDLERRGAVPKLIVIPGADGKKVGFDDFVVANGIGAYSTLTRIGLNHKTLIDLRGWYKSWVERKETETKDSKPTSKRALSFIEPLPWEQPVVLADLLDEMVAEIKKYIVVEEDALQTEALWMVHAHAFDSFDISPFLVFSSAVKESGKSKSMEVTSCIVPKGFHHTSCTPASLARAVDQCCPTLLVDEADTFVNLHPELQGIFNASHLRNSAFILRCVGDEQTPTKISVWCPKAIALIGNLPSTVSSRAITIRMKRRKKSEVRQKFRASRPHPELMVLKRKCMRWAQDNLDALKSADPTMPDALQDRQQDNWAPLFAVADLAGGPWPRRARDAALKIEKASAEMDEQPIGTELLWDIFDIFEGRNTDRIFSEDLVKALAELADRPWATWFKGKPITMTKVAAVLKDFGIRTNRSVKIAGISAKGYLRWWFDDSFERYPRPQKNDKEEDGPQKTGSEKSPQSLLNENNNLDENLLKSPNGSVTSSKSDLSNGKDYEVTGVTSKKPKWEMEL